MVQQQATDILLHEYLGPQQIQRVKGVSVDTLAFQNLLVVQQNIESENVSELRRITSIPLEKVSHKRFLNNVGKSQLIKSLYLLACGVY